MFGFLDKILHKETKEDAKVRSRRYKTLAELTKQDFELIDADRDATGIYGHSDEYYYNHILYHNFE